MDPRTPSCQEEEETAEEVPPVWIWSIRGPGWTRCELLPLSQACFLIEVLFRNYDCSNANNFIILADNKIWKKKLWVLNLNQTRTKNGCNLVLYRVLWCKDTYILAVFNKQDILAKSGKNYPLLFAPHYYCGQWKPFISDINVWILVYTLYFNEYV